LDKKLESKSALSKKIHSILHTIVGIKLGLRLEGIGGQPQGYGGNYQGLQPVPLYPPGPIPPPRP